MRLLLCERGAAVLESRTSKLAFKSTSSNFALPKKLLELYPSHRPPKTTAQIYLRRVAGRARAAIPRLRASIDANRREQHKSNQVTTNARESAALTPLTFAAAPRGRETARGAHALPQPPIPRRLSALDPRRRAVTAPDSRELPPVDSCDCFCVPRSVSSIVNDTAADGHDHARR